MKKYIILFCVAMGSCINPVQAQWVVTDPTNLAQGIINTAKQIIETSATASNTLNSFKEAVKIYEQSKEYYDALKAVNHLVRDARKVQKTVLMIGEINEIYVTNYAKMLGDENFSGEELTAISDGYTTLLRESAGALSDLGGIINPSTLSMSDRDRMDFIDGTYKEVLELKNLIIYFTRKNVSVSYLRAQKKRDKDQVINLYDNGSKYW